MRKILDKDPQSITEVERDILKARRSYLTEEEIKKFKLDEEAAPVVAPEEPASAPKPESKPAKKSKKS